MRNTYNYISEGLYMVAKTFRDCPESAIELDLTKNRDLTYKGKPINVLDLVAGTGKRLDWKCSTCRHEWKTAGSHRVSGKGCPACVNQVINNFDGRNSMAVTHPQLSNDYQGDATKVIAGTNKKLDWKCSTCEHEWSANGSDRCYGNGCPACANQVINNFDGRNSMANTHPELAKEYQGDAKLIKARTSKKLDWKCSTCEREWNATGGDRCNGDGCKICSKKNHKSKVGQKFIDNANIVHNGKYVYDKVNYINCDTKVLIGCEIHGYFEQIPYNHYNKKMGCRYCGKRDMTADMFVESCEKIWGDTYDLSKVHYTKSNKSITPLCKIHGLFSIRASHFTQGHGCKNCTKYGFSPNDVAYIYIHSYIDNTTNWLKCGITNHPEQRFKQLTRAASRANIEVQPLDIYTFDDGWVAQTCEQELLTTLELRFNSEYDIEGKAEFFNHNALDEIKDIINKYQPNRN